MCPVNVAVKPKAGEMLSIERMQGMLRSVRPTWSIVRAERVAVGHHLVARLDVEAPTDHRTVYLKATPPGKPPSVDLEARVLAGIQDQSAIPVPTVLGAVDDHEKLPAPYVVLAAMPGEMYERSALPAMADHRLRRIAQQYGRYLAALHHIDAVDYYGMLDCTGPPMHGERPAGTFQAMTVTDGTGSWRTCLETWSQDALAGLEDTRFADIREKVEPVLRRRVDAISGSFEPVLARIDGAIENVLLEGADLSGLIDWEFTVAATRDYDLACVVWSLAGGPYLYSTEFLDCRELVRAALLDGYTSSVDDGMKSQFHQNRACYELLITIRSMVHLNAWCANFGLDPRVAEHRVRRELAVQLQRDGH